MPRGLTPFHSRPRSDKKRLTWPEPSASFTGSRAHVDPDARCQFRAGFYNPRASESASGFLLRRLSAIEKAIIAGTGWTYFRFRCTWAATLRRSALRRMNPVASSWLYALVGSASIVAIAGLYKLTGDLRPATMMLPL